MAEACRALQIPVIGGNVSFYNESGGEDIDPSPVVATLGVIDRLDRRPPGAVFEDGASLVMLGARSRELGGSRWAWELRSHHGGVLPGVDLQVQSRLLVLVADLVRAEGLVRGIHDVSGGGIGVALAECALSSGVGCEVRGVAGHAELFSEAPGRVVVCTTAPDEVCARAQTAGVSASVIGETGGSRVVVRDLLDLPVGAITESWRGALPAALGESA
jgi:phosphoribosylformylglycinamidine synthase